VASMDGPGRVYGNDRADRLGDSPQAVHIWGLSPIPRYIPRFELGGTIPLIRK
jgi:hypothetical protein